VLTDVLESAVPSHLDLRDAARHARGELAQVEPLARLVVPVYLLEEHRTVRQVEQGVEEVPVVAEAVPPTSGGLRLLTLDRQVQVVGDVLDYLVPGPIHCDVPAVPADRQRERQEE
jgi:hypothetical protein